MLFCLYFSLKTTDKSCKTMPLQSFVMPSLHTSVRKSRQLEILFIVSSYCFGAREIVVVVCFVVLSKATQPSYGSC